LDFLGERGLSEGTITVLTSDHGEEFLDHGEVGHGKALYQESLHVPLIIRWPAKIAAGQRIDAPVELVDLMDTLLGLARLPVPQPQDGSFLFRARKEPPPLFANLRLDGRDLWSVRTDRWKLILDRKSDEPKLFDLSSDPDESHDLSGDHPDRVRELRKLIAGRIERDQGRSVIVRKPEDSEGISEGELSDETRDVLRSLGYIK
jgi:arylsulfatase A-like enzyme